MEWSILQSSLRYRCTSGVCPRIYTFPVLVKRLGSFRSWVISIKLDVFVRLGIKSNDRLRVGQGDTCGVEMGDLLL